jgi:hypothetical protein
MKSRSHERTHQQLNLTLAATRDSLNYSAQASKRLFGGSQGGFAILGRRARGESNQNNFYPRSLDLPFSPFLVRSRWREREDPGKPHEGISKEFIKKRLDEENQI